MNIPEPIKTRLRPDHATTTITLRIPVDVADSLKTIAPLKGYMSEKRAALEAWERELGTIQASETGSNVVRMRRKNNNALRH